MWMAAVEWLDSVVAVRPYWLVRTMAGISMDLGMSLLVFNLMRTALTERVPERMPRGVAWYGASA
jgi:cytochrome c oxidase cbb3-type subunit 1